MISERSCDTENSNDADNSVWSQEWMSWLF